MSRIDTESDKEQHMLQYKQYVKLRSNVMNQTGSRVMKIELVTVHTKHGAGYLINESQPSKDKKSWGLWIVHRCTTSSTTQHCETSHLTRITPAGAQINIKHNDKNARKMHERSSC